MSDCSGMINKTCLSKTFHQYLYVQCLTFVIKVQGRFLKAVSVAEFLPICFETALFETPIVLTTMKGGAVATFLWVIASLSVQSGMYQLIEKLLAYLSVVLHVSFFTLSIFVFQSILVYLFIYLLVCLFFTTGNQSSPQWLESITILISELQDA